MKSSFVAFFLLRILGAAITLLCVSSVYILAEPQRLSYFSLLLFKNQETLKTLAICGIFLGVFCLFYSSSKTPEKFLKVKLLSGPIKMHPDMLKQTLEIWLQEEKLNNLKLTNVTVAKNNTIGLEMTTSDMESALYSLEGVELKLKNFMTTTFGIETTVDVQLYEI